MNQRESTIQTMACHKHFVTTRSEFDSMTYEIHESEKGSHHLICFHGHGNAETDNCPLYDLNQIIKTAFENDKSIYIIAISCFWNEKYKKGLTVPTISLAPDVGYFIPYSVQNLRERINSLPDNFDKEFIINWFQKMKTNLNNMMDCWSFDENGKQRKKDYLYVLKYNDNRLEAEEREVERKQTDLIRRLERVSL